MSMSMSMGNRILTNQQGKALKELTDVLLKNGFKAYLAGGAVRDYILGKEYKDLDIVTDASIDVLQKLFSKTIPVGAKFGILRVVIEGYEFEVAQFRRDGPYKDGRHPESVIFASPEEDAHRRDFTINSLFYDFKTNQIIDYVNGIEDIKKQTIKTVGSPEKRFAEDYLRILRAIRFSCQLGFEIEEETERAAEKLSYLLNKISGERLSVEISKALYSNPQKALFLLSKWKIPTSLFPNWKVDEKNAPMVYLKGRSELGWLLSQWVLSYQRSLCLGAIEMITSEKWKFSEGYRDLIAEVTKKFRLSKLDSNQMKYICSVLAWPNIWLNLRFGFRAELAQSEGFKVILDAASQMQAWDGALLQEVTGLQSKPKYNHFLRGEDVIKLSLTHRGLVLNESLYLQYEGIIHSREEALIWLKNRFPGDI